MQLIAIKLLLRAVKLLLRAVKLLLRAVKLLLRAVKHFEYKDILTIAKFAIVKFK